MDWTPNHTRLRARLAELFLDKDTAQRIATEAGLDPALMTLSQTASNNWYELVRYAETRGLLVPLINQAMKELPKKEDRELKEALDLIEAERKAYKPIVQTPMQPISDVQLRDFIKKYFNKDAINEVLADITEILRQNGKQTPALDIDTFSSESKPIGAIALAMVQYFRHRTWTPFLIAGVKAANPDAFRETFGE